MVFSTNQNRQLYVVNEVVTSEPTSVGQIQINTIDNGAAGSQVYYKYYGAGGLIRSDLIDVDKIVYAKVTEADAMAIPLKKATITLNSDINGGAPISGQDYIVRIVIYNYIGIGDDNTYFKYGAVHATAGMTAATFYEKLAASLEANFSREVAPLFTFEASDSGVTVTEVEQPWVLGTFPIRPVNFKIYVTPVTYEGDEVIWADVNDEGYIDIENSGETIGNGKKIADLEYFCAGEKGDQYRNVGWPNVIPTKYLVDPDEEYAVLDLHYAFSDTGVNVHKSEKDITFVATDSSVLTGLIPDGVTAS